MVGSLLTIVVMSLGAPGVKEKTPAVSIVGIWEVTSSTQAGITVGSTIEYSKDGKTKLTASNFNEEFLKNSPIDTVQKALDSVRTGVGSCQAVGRMESSTPLAASVLLSDTSVPESDARRLDLRLSYARRPTASRWRRCRTSTSIPRSARTPPTRSPRP